MMMMMMMLLLGLYVLSFEPHNPPFIPFVLPRG